VRSNGGCSPQCLFPRTFTLTWQEISLERKEIERITQKRRKKVIVPLNAELLFALEAERELRSPAPTERVLINPATGRNMTRPRLYQRMLALGRRAGVPNAHPHRFRDTLAVDMLEKGASPYDVAKTLGDTIETIERHYAPFTKELRDRVRRIMENGEGLEKTLDTFWTQLGVRVEKPN
jgi:integrase